MSIDELYENSQRIRPSELRDEVLMSIDHRIIDTITEQQLQLGIDANNQPFPTYAPGNYAEYKNQKNSKSGGRYDLNDTGDWYSGLFQQLTDTAIVVDSTDSKNDKIKDMMSGYSYLGLTPENFSKVQTEDAIPEFMKRVKELMKID